MTTTTGFRTGAPIFSPEFTDMIDRCVDLFKLEIVQGLAFESEPALMTARGLQANPSRMGAIVARRLASGKPGGKRGRVPAPLKDGALSALYTAEIRSLARRYNVDLSAAKPVSRQINASADFTFLAPQLTSEPKLRSLADNILDLQIDEDDQAEGENTLRRLAPNLTLDPSVLRLLSDSVRPVRVNDLSGGGTLGAASGSIVVNKGLEFRIHKVKCIDETNPEWPGDDEIAMGGTAVPPVGSPTKIPEFRVSNSFDDGESRVYNPPRLLKTFSLSNVSYPADFLVVLALAEKDNGGLSDFLQEMWEAIKDEVQIIIAAVAAAAGAAIGSAIGGTVGTAIGGPLGTIIGAVAGAILGALVGWIISAVKDDIFTPQSAAVHLPTPNATFTNGALTSPQFTVNFNDHGGYYRVYYSWKINR